LFKYAEFIKVVFNPAIFHPNVFDGGAICLSILKSEKNYSPSLSMAQLLVGIQTLLIEPNLNDPANWEAREMYIKQKQQFDQRTKAFAKKCADVEKDE
jgi:ubiquitin-conjugating enzyme E2 I